MKRRTLLQESDPDSVTRNKRAYTYTEAQELAEAAYDAESGEVELTVIQPGFNKTRARFYPADVLKRDHAVFADALMFLDHATKLEEQARPEGSVRNWAGVMKKVWVEESGAIKGRAVVIDDGLRSKLSNLQRHGLLGQMGVSIRATGEVRETEIDGKKTNLVERLVSGKSVDFVTRAGAGGRVELFESEEDAGMIEQLQEQLASMQKELDAKNQALATVTQRMEEAEKAGRCATARVQILALVGKSGLPDVAQSRLLERFAAAENADAVAEAIESERQYIDALGAKPITGSGQAKSVVRNLGESRPADSVGKDALVAAYRRLSLSESEARVAAGLGN